MVTGTSLTPTSRAKNPQEVTQRGNLISLHGQKSTYRHGLEPNSG